MLHAIVFLIEMAVATRLAAKFNSYYAERPGKSDRRRHHFGPKRHSKLTRRLDRTVLTTMVTNAVRLFLLFYYIYNTTY